MGLKVDDVDVEAEKIPLVNQNEEDENPFANMQIRQQLSNVTKDDMKTVKKEVEAEKKKPNPLGGLNLPLGSGGVANKQEQRRSMLMKLGGPRRSIGSRVSLLGKKSGEMDKKKSGQVGYTQNKTKVEKPAVSMTASLAEDDEDAIFGCDSLDERETEMMLLKEEKEHLQLKYEVQDYMEKLNTNEVRWIDRWYYWYVENFRGFVSYHFIAWFLVIFATAFTVIDRFSVNYWPGKMPYHPNGVGSLNMWPWTDKLEDHKAILVFKWLAMLSGRLTLTGLVVVFLTECKVFFNWLKENSPHWLDMSEADHVNNRLHIWSGIWLIGIPVVLHVWSVYVPGMVGYHTKYLTAFDRSGDLSCPVRPGEKTPGKCSFAECWKDYTLQPYFDEEVGAWIPEQVVEAGCWVTVAIDDVYRLICMSLIFIVIVPFMYSNWMQKYNYTASWYIHILCAIHFAIDDIRKSSHPHVHFFNTPFVLMWIIDKIIRRFCYRSNNAKVVQKIVMDDDYILLFMKFDDPVMNKIGDAYYLDVPGCNIYDMCHEFTSFANHKLQKMRFPTTNGNNFYDVKKVGNTYFINRNENFFQDELDAVEKEKVLPKASGKIREDFVNAFGDTNEAPAPKQKKGTGSVIRQTSGQMARAYTIVHNKADVADSDRNTAIRDASDWDVCIVASVFNPHPGNRMPFTYKALINDLDTLRCLGPYRSNYAPLNQDNLPPIVLIATGAGCSYLMGFVNNVIAMEKQFKYPVKIYYSTNNLMLFQFVTNWLCRKEIENMTVDAHLTSLNFDTVFQVPREVSEDGGARMACGRLSIDEIIERMAILFPETEVYYCGNPFLDNRVNNLCSRFQVHYHKGHVFGGGGKDMNCYDGCMRKLGALCPAKKY